MKSEDFEKSWLGSRAVASPAQMVAKGLPKMEWAGRLTNSARSTFLNCRQKFAWQYLFRLSPRSPQVPFVVGNLVHAGLDRMYKSGSFDEDEEREVAAAACEKACMTPGITEALSDKIWVQQAMVMGILRGYAANYLIKDAKAWEVLEAEEAFAYGLPNGWTNEGKRDLVVRRKKDGKVGLVEHKTTSMLNAAYIAKLPLDNQILGYANSMRKEKKFGMKLPAFVVYNVMKKCGLRQKQSESFDDFKKRVEADYLGGPTLYFYRETLTFTEKDVDQYERGLVKFTEEMDRAIKEKYFYQNTTQCTQYGACPYMRLCSEGVTTETLSHYQVRKNVHAELESAEEAYA